MESTVQKKKSSAGAVFLWILYGLSALLFFAVLELGKYTITGWILAAVLFIGYAVLRATVLKKTKFILRLLCLLALIGCLALCLQISFPPVQAVPAVSGKSAGETAVVHVQQGDLVGVLSEDGSVEVFAGVPYAQPPVGELRWREPQDALPWKGIRKADTFAPMSMQTQQSTIYQSLARIIGYHDYKISFSDNYREPVSEDSLYLNIWKPAGQCKDLPVLVYVHGGSLQTGQPWYEDYSGQGLAKDGIIAITFGYRLGVFGFFADEELQQESPNGTTGNYGLLDQIKALTWVRDNVAAFGGDPENVTLAGESAGSACVSALCTSPLAKGLFKRVVGESSTVTAPQPAHSFRLLSEAFEAARQTKERFGAASVRDLRALPAEKLANEMQIHHHITIDGYVLTETPYESYRKGVHNEEAQFQGFNREESAPFILFGQANRKNYREKLISGFGEEYAEKILTLYPASTDAEARRNWADIYTAALFTYGHHCWLRQANANGVPAYVYHFTRENGRLGSWHSGEEVYLYGNIPPDSSLYDETDRALADTMHRYFCNFIRTGDPNGDGLPLWSAGSETSLLAFGDRVQEEPAPYLALYAIFDELYGWESEQKAE